MRLNAARKDPKSAMQTIQLLELQEKAALELKLSNLKEAGSNLTPANPTRQAPPRNTTGYAMVGGFVDQSATVNPECRAALLNSSCDLDTNIDLHHDGSDHEVQPADANRLRNMYRQLPSKDERELVKPLTVTACSNQMGDLLVRTNSDFICEPTEIQDFR